MGEIELRMERMTSGKLDNEATGAKLSREAAETSFVLVSRGSIGQLISEVGGGEGALAGGGGIVYGVLCGGNTQRTTQVFGRTAVVHADKEAGLRPRTTGPALHQVIHRTPSPKVKISDAEIGAYCDLQGLTESGQ